jgi:hypothetical protein
LNQQTKLIPQQSTPLGIGYIYELMTCAIIDEEELDSKETRIS